MNKIKYFVFRMITNKYSVVTLLFVLYLLFFDRFNIPSQIRRYNETQQIERYRQFYADEIQNNHQALEDLHSGLRAKERFGRETYYMRRDNEDIFIVELKEKE